MNQINAVVKNESLLIPKILLEQRTLRLAGIIPTWENFVTTEHFWEIKRARLEPRGIKKYQAWWNLCYRLMRDEKDKPTLLYATALLVQERLKRSYSKYRAVNPEAFRLDRSQGLKVEEYVLTHYESLNPV